MNKRNCSLYLGISLVLFGLLNLLRTFHIIYFEEDLIASVLFFVVAGYLFERFRQSRRPLILILASVLAFFGAAILIDNLHLEDALIAVLFMWGSGSLFAYGFFRDGRSWGFLIPAGILFTIGFMVLIELSPGLDDDLLGGLFFLGIAGTFGFLYLIRNEHNKLEWAKYPALILAIFSGFVFLVTQSSQGAHFILPLILIAIGAVLVYKSTHRRLLR